MSYVGNGKYEINLGDSLVTCTPEDLIEAYKSLLEKDSPSHPAIKLESAEVCPQSFYNHLNSYMENIVSSYDDEEKRECAFDLLDHVRNETSAFYEQNYILLRK
jgi:hypothetical protein